VRDFSKGTDQKDDLTAVVLKRKNIVTHARKEAAQNELVTVTT
jgi:hypothetical protein